MGTVAWHVWDITLLCNCGIANLSLCPFLFINPYLHLNFIYFYKEVWFDNQCGLTATWQKYERISWFLVSPGRCVSVTVTIIPKQYFLSLYYLQVLKLKILIFRFHFVFIWIPQVFCDSGLIIQYLIPFRLHPWKKKALCSLQFSPFFSCVHRGPEWFVHMSVKNFRSWCHVLINWQNECTRIKRKDKMKTEARISFWNFIADFLVSCVLIMTPFVAVWLQNLGGLWKDTARCGKYQGFTINSSIHALPYYPLI